LSGTSPDSPSRRNVFAYNQIYGVDTGRRGHRAAGGLANGVDYWAIRVSASHRPAILHFAQTGSHACRPAHVQRPPLTNPAGTPRA
jgi:hypothetical protein